MKPTDILITARHLAGSIELYRPEFEKRDCRLHFPQRFGGIEPSELKQLLRGVKGVICGDDRFSADVLRSAPDLHVICKWGTGIDSIDVHAANNLGIRVLNSPDALTIPVADSVFAYLLAFAREIRALDKSVRRGQWSAPESRSLSECTLGVIGIGNIGQEVMRRARSFQMTVCAHDIEPTRAEFYAEVGAAFVGLDDLLVRADFVSLHCPLTESTHHLLSRDRLRLLKPDAIVINTARGALIDEKALISVLESRKIRGAALDVFEVEPLPAESPLRRLGNVYLAPHAANSSPLFRERTNQRTVDQLLSALDL